MKVNGCTEKDASSQTQKDAFGLALTPALCLAVLEAGATPAVHPPPSLIL